MELSTPASVVNPPGQPALAWRAGTHARFKRSMLANLASEPALRPLTTRDDDDPTIALIDSWAVALDVLTFYQERIANENYLRTATERRSVLELARAVGYELAPGVSASTELAFELETAPTAPLSAVLPAGTKVQSIPGQDERPQLYETSESLTARGAWNAIPVRWRDARKPSQDGKTIFLAGISTGLQVGEALLVVEAAPANANAPRGDFRHVGRLETVTDPLDASRNYTRVELDRELVTTKELVVRVFGMRQRVGLFGGNAPDYSLLPKATRAEIEEAGKGPAAGLREIVVIARRASIPQRIEWPNFNIGYAATQPTSLDTLYLDNAYKAAVKGSWLVAVNDENTEQAYRITQADESGMAVFGVTGKSTRVKLIGDTAKLASNTFWTKLRETAVFLQTEEFDVAERSIGDPLAATDTVDLEIELTGDDTLPPGRRLIVSEIGPKNTTVADEVVTVKRTDRLTGDGSTSRTRVTLETVLTRSYLRKSTLIRANVVKATHGETTLRTLPNGSIVSEILGSGDASLPFQSFVLKQKPLTYVPAATASGRATTLVVRVDGVRWKEVASFYDVARDEHVYTVRQGDDGSVTIRFGDGVTGARLPTGIENVTAVYRVGTGLEGLVDAGQLTLLMSRPLGVKAVVNPLPSSGADDPEKLADARENAPVTVLTLDRVVSLTDYEDFARAFAGIGKATVALLWTGEQQTVHLTIGLADASVPADQSQPMIALRGALDGARHVLRPVIVSGYEARAFSITATVAVDPAYETAVVMRQVTDALLAHFAFAKRQFAQAVTESETIAVMQRVRGVVYVDLDSLTFVAGNQPAADGRLEAKPARIEGTAVRAAELLTLAASDIHLTSRAP